MSRRALRAGLAAATLALAGTSARGHDFATTEVLALLRTDGTFQIDLRVDADALALGVAPTTHSAEVVDALRSLSPAEFDAALARVEDTIARWTRPRFDGARAEVWVSFPQLGTPLADSSSATPTVIGTQIRLTGRVPQGAREFTFGASRALKAVHLTLLDEAALAGSREMLEPGADSRPWRIGESAAPKSRAAVLAEYVVLGFEHILPRGLDHILFVLGLFLLSTRLSSLLWQVTAFTVAHTLTLALSMYGVVSLPSRWVESLIALSIAYVALENVATSELKPWRPLLVFGFGLLHGLGFAGVLRELGLPREEFVTALVGFNVGVEAGQLTVIGLAFLAVGWFRRRPWYRVRIVVPCSVAIALVGLYWAVERAGWLS